MRVSSVDWVVSARLELPAASAAALTASGTLLLAVGGYVANLVQVNGGFPPYAVSLQDVLGNTLVGQLFSTGAASSGGSTDNGASDTSERRRRRLLQTTAASTDPVTLVIDLTGLGSYGTATAAVSAVTSAVTSGSSFASKVLALVGVTSASAKMGVVNLNGAPEAFAKVTLKISTPAIAGGSAAASGAAMAATVLSALQGGSLMAALGANTSVGSPVAYTNASLITVGSASGTPPVFSLLPNQNTPLMNPCVAELVDGAALQAFAAAWGAVSATIKANWTGDPCAAGWLGVTCSAVCPQRAVGINLDGLVSLKGATIPTAIGQLYKLRSFDIGNTGIGGTLPTSIGGLSSLTGLVVANTSLSGAIPTQLGSLANLNTLSLGGTSLSGALPSNLADSSNVRVAVDVAGSSIRFCSGATPDCGSPYYARVMREGYLTGCLVFIDSDGSGVYDSSKLAAITDDEGTLTLYGTVDGPLVAIPGGNCIDSGSGLALDVPVSAPPGSCVVSPLTTLEVAIMAANATADMAAAASSVRGLLGIPIEATAFGQLDYVNLALNASADGIAALGAAAKIVDLVSMVSAAAAAEATGMASDGSDAYSATVQAAAAVFYATLAAEVAAGGPPVGNKDSQDAVIYSAIHSLAGAVNASALAWAAQGFTPVSSTISPALVGQIGTMATMVGTILSAAATVAAQAQGATVGEDFLALGSAFAYGTPHSVTPQVVQAVLQSTTQRDFAAGGVLSILALVDTTDITTTVPTFLPTLTAAAKVGVCGEGAVTVPPFHASSYSSPDFLYQMTHGTGLILLVTFASVLGVGGAAGAAVLWTRARVKVKPTRAKPAAQGPLRTFHTTSVQVASAPAQAGGTWAQPQPRKPPREMKLTDSGRIMREQLSSQQMQLEDADDLSPGTPLLGGAGPSLPTGRGLLKNFRGGGGWI